MNTDKTIPRLFLRRVMKKPEATAIGWIYKNELKTYRYDHYASLVAAIANNLNAKGLRKGDRLAILADTCKEWHLVDIACMCVGIVVIPIYHTYVESEIQYILNHSKAKFLFLDNNVQFKKILQIKNNLPHLESIFHLHEVDRLEELGKSSFTFHELTTSNEEEASSMSRFKKNTEFVHEDDLATVVYTSGTTGEPKGAVITHRAISAMLFNLRSSLSGAIGKDDRNLCFLPLSHVFGRADSLLHLPFGLEVIYAEGIDKILRNLNLATPTMLLAVPRIFEKFYAKVMSTFDEGPLYKKKLFEWAMKVSNQYFSKIEKDLAPTSFEIIERNLAYKLVFSKIYEKFGGKIRFFVSGGAPLSVDIIKFLRNSNLTVLEGYGLTETIAPCTVNPPSKQIAGTVGIPVGDVQVDFASDGEILIKSEALFSGYLDNPTATEESFDQGWFKTGDIGVMTAEGYLMITDRKKDIIITAGGKNVAPQKIENMMKLKKYITHFMVIGDKRNYLTGVVGIDKESFQEDFEKLGIKSTDTVTQIAMNPKVIAAIKQQVDEVNEELARFESIKKIFIAPTEFSVESGEITPSLKLKKKVLMEKFKEEINAMY